MCFFLLTAQNYRQNGLLELRNWLHSNHLDHYFESFERSEIIDLKKIAELKLPNEDLYDELEIVMPGHRKRLERAGIYIICSCLV